MAERESGLLLHITSLPSPYGIGDLGPSAYRFADYLHDAGQKYWQVLPLNPTTLAYDNSPYLSTSAFAGNTNLISPELLVRDTGLESATRPGSEFPADHVNYPGVEAFKKELFSRAFSELGDTTRQTKEYQDFCEDNRGWLDDYALFHALCGFFTGKDWNT